MYVPGSLEHSPSDSFRRKSLLAESGRAPCDVQLREDLAEAMKEDHGILSLSILLTTIAFARISLKQINGQRNVHSIDITLSHFFQFIHLLYTFLPT